MVHSMRTRTRLVAPGLLAVSLTASVMSAHAHAAGGLRASACVAPGVCRIPHADLRRSIEERLQERPPAAVTEDQWRRVRALYARRGDSAVWLDTAGAGASARDLARGLADASSHGLILDPAAVDSLRAALARVRRAGVVSARDVADADVRLSAAFVTLAEYLLVGQLDPRTVTRDWHIAPRRADVDSAIVRRAATAPLAAAVAALAPDDPVYAALREQLAVYRGIVAQGGWTRVPPGPTLRAGDRGDPARLSALTRRLARERYLPDTASSGDVYDARLADAVARFQAHHAVRVDGALSPETVTALDVPAEYRTAQIAVNLERIRWLPHATQGRHLIVNVPSFRLLLRDGPRTTMSMKVVVGAEYRNRATPVFADSMTYVVFQPYWNVTPSITLGEVIPKRARDPGYLARNDYEVVRGDGDDAPVVGVSLLTSDAVRAGRVRVRQRPGRTNALGHAKFIFPNAYNVYLHDTPARALFEEDVRAFSHGCIRVEKPAELARWVLGWDSARVAAAMAEGRPNRYVPLARKLPVFIIYLTAFTRDGELFFGNDLYSLDGALVRRLASTATPDARTARALEALGELTAP
jgi:L,D-transpeptidase YcbB